MRTTKKLIKSIADVSVGVIIVLLLGIDRFWASLKKIRKSLQEFYLKLNSSYEKLLTDIVQFRDTIIEKKTNFYLHPDLTRKPEPDPEIDSESAYQASLPIEVDDYTKKSKKLPFENS